MQRYFGGGVRPVRQQDGSATWQIISDATHTPVGLAYAEVGRYAPSTLAIVFENFCMGAPGVGTVIVAVDDGFCRKGITVGASLGQTNANIVICHEGIQIDPARVFDHIDYADGDGNIWLFGFNLVG